MTTMGVWCGFANAGFLTVLCACTDGPEPTADADPRESVAWFTDVTADVGLDFIHNSGATGGLLLPEIMGAGVAFLDYDGDGDLDVYLVNGGLVTADHAPPINRLYRQEADGTFVDVTAESGLGDAGNGMGVAVGDIDNDGRVDVYVTNYGLDTLYRNRGDGTFTDITEAAGIHVPGWSASAAFVDYDRDGFLDLYVTQYVDFDPSRRCFTPTGKPEFCGPKVFPPVPDVLLHNDGDGTFTDVSLAAGIADRAAAGLGIVCQDFNDDGWIDLYVVNDAYPNFLWINETDGRFCEAAVSLGAAYNLHGEAEAGMGVVAADLDNDTLADLFVTHLSFETNTHYRNLGPGVGFVDVTGETGLAADSMPYTGFGVAAFDLDLDGDDDLVVVNGRVNRLQPLPGAWVEPPWDVLAEPNLVYLNDGTGSFSPAGPGASAVCDPIEVTRGLAVGDVDSDGDIDLLIGNVQGPARLYRNDTPRLGHWLSVRVVDPRLNRDALGARITLWCGERRLVKTARRSCSYLSSVDPRVHFGLGPAARVDRIDVRWPDGLHETFPGSEVDRMVELARGTGEVQP